jgi:putative ABC transport system permease protein
MVRLIRRLRYLVRQRRYERELLEEMAFHRSMLARRSLGEGETDGRAFGNATLAREDAHDVWVWRWLTDALQDARYAVRSLRRQPAFAAAAIAIVALGTGATTCVFGLLDALVLKSLPVERADRLVWFRDPAFSHPIYTYVHDTLPVFDGFFGWSIDRAYVDWRGTGGELIATDVLEATPEFFPALRVRAALGRTFDSHDTAAAVISHAAWVRYFGRDPSVVGRTIRVGDVSYGVIGVAPERFFGVAPGLAPDVFVPVASRRSAADLAAPTSAWLHLMGRLKDGTTLEQTNAALQVVWPAVMAATTNPGMPADRKAIYLARTTALEPGRTGYSPVRNAFGEPLRLLMGLAALLLAIACASVSNLLLARSVARRREIAIRLAIGAERGRVSRQLFTEAIVVALAGAALGLVLASWAGGLLVAFMTTTREQFSLDTSANWRMATFAVGLAGLVSAVSTVLPALIATRSDLMSGLKDGGQAGAGLLRRWTAGKALVAAQVALAVVLLGGAALFGRSLARVLAQDTGLSVERLLAVFPDASAAGYRGSAVSDFERRLVERIDALPGVEATAVSWMPPISNDMGNWTQNITVDGAAPPATETRYVYFNAVSPRYFETVGIRVQRGRGFAESDSGSSLRVVVINESLARRYFAGQDPIGHRLAVGKATARRDLEIVGVVQDAKYRTLQEPARSIAYMPVAQTPDVLSGRDLVVNVRAANPLTVAPAVRNAARTLDARVPVRVQPVADRLRESTLNERLIAMLAGVLGVAALVLASAGLYGLLGYAVTRHAREIGLRIALGARPASVLWMVQRESLRLAVLGVAGGLAAMLALGRFVKSVLFQITPADPVALAGATAAMLFVACAAGYLPARRAASVDPVVALKRDS